ncbi:putative MFS transporter [Desulfurococcaceae archaeon AG1]|jgi:MFS family permease|nr:putative MFS transporter [Desulfurococcaceae archaeon AG1]
MDRNLAIMIISAALSSLSSSIYIYQARFYATQEGFDYGVQSIYEVYSYAVSIFLVLGAGFLSDVLGRRFFTFLAYFLGFVSASSLALLPSWVGFPLSIILYNSAFALVIVARNVLVIDLAGPLTARWLGYIMTASSIFMVVGPIAGSTFREWLGYRGLFTLLSILWLMASISFLYIDEPRARINRSNASIPTPEEILGFIASLRNLWPITLYSCIDRFSFYLWMPLISAYFSEKGFSDSEVAILYAVQNLTWFLGSYAFGLLAESRAIYVLALSEALTGLSALAMSINPVPGALAPYISFILMGASIASWIPSYNAILGSLVTSHARGGLYSTIYVLATVAGLPAPYIGSMIRSLFGGEAHFLASFAISTSNALFLLLFIKKRYEIQAR